MAVILDAIRQGLRPRRREQPRDDRAAKPPGLTALSSAADLPAERLHLHVANLADEVRLPVRHGHAAQSACPRSWSAMPEFYPCGGLLDTSGALWDEIMAINLKAPSSSRRASRS